MERGYGISEVETRTGLIRIAVIATVLVIAGTLSTLWIASCQRGKEKRRVDDKLDNALAESMDCSDPTGTY